MSEFIEVTIKIPATIGVQSRGESTNVDMTKKPAHIIAQYLEYGVVQKHADCVSDGKDIQAKWADLETRMNAGEWRGKRAGGSVDEHAAYRKELNGMLNDIIKQKDSKAKANQETRDKVWDQLPDETQAKLAATAKARMEKAKAELAAISLDIEL